MTIGRFFEYQITKSIKRQALGLGLKKSVKPSRNQLSEYFRISELSLYLKYET
jgi:hypothetical protein